MSGTEPFRAQKELARANRAFYRAFEQLDLSAMSAVWEDDDVVKCVHPGWELLSGRERVIESWATIFANTKSIRFELSDLEVTVLGDLGWVTCFENITSEIGPSRFGAKAVATNLFALKAGAWKLVLHHASPVT